MVSELSTTPLGEGAGSDEPSQETCLKIWCRLEGKASDRLDEGKVHAVSKRGLFVFNKMIQRRSSSVRDCSMQTVYQENVLEVEPFGIDPIPRGGAPRADQSRLFTIWFAST